MYIYTYMYIYIIPASTPNIGLGGFNDRLQSVARQRNSNKRQRVVEGDLSLGNDNVWRGDAIDASLTASRGWQPKHKQYLYM